MIISRHFSNMTQKHIWKDSLFYPWWCGNTSKLDGKNNKEEKVRFKNSQNKWSRLSEYRREQKRVIECLPRKGQTGFKHDPIFSSDEELHCRESSCGWQALIRPCVESLIELHAGVRLSASTQTCEGCCLSDRH